ncbi:type VI secretion system tip protein TssI/VgrG [Geobacter sp.]|uniref:type VI secretion system Vgr family protein n=1 Tax=Geobacter sp. TaxID=46610 RepID=UPI0026019DF0|nr:type VI secretion system tip protein TssI/VgrG [Geobacter sp.]
MSGSSARFLFSIAGIAFETRVVEFQAIEGISTTFDVTVTIACGKEHRLSFREVAGREATLTVVSSSRPGINLATKKPDDPNRYFSGVVVKLKPAGTIGTYNLYRLRLVPSLWLLTFERDCRIFQNADVTEIVSTVLKDARILSDRFEFRPIAKPPKQEYRVQYRETDFNLVSRLLEEEGFFYWFEHDKARHFLVLTNDKFHCLPIKGDPVVPLAAADGRSHGSEFVSAFSFSHRVRPGAYSQNSFNERNLDLELEAGTSGDLFDNLEVYDYTGDYKDPERGDFLAKLRLEEQKVMRKKYRGESNCPRLTPGHRFTLEDRINGSLDDEYLIAAVAHSGSQPQALDAHAGSAGHYSNSFVCFLADYAFRPARITPKPVVTGLQSAIVVGREGAEIETDDLGRIKVQFHWDREGKRDERSSCWLRVAQGWAGLFRGMQFIPRVGDEVLVDFLEGDPDRPIVVGSVYNGDNPPIYQPGADNPVSGIKTRSTPKGEGFNELRFNDRKGAEEISIHGERDWRITIKNDKIQEIGGASSTTVKGPSTERAQEITLTAESKITLLCGGSTIVLEPSGVTIIGPTVNINK